MATNAKVEGKAKSEQPEMPAPTRSEREIAFMLRKAKQRQGPEVLRALAAREIAGAL